MSCAVGSTWPSGGRRSTHSCVAVRDRVGEVRAAAGDQRRRAAARRSRRRRARRTTAAVGRDRHPAASSRHAGRGHGACRASGPSSCGARTSRTRAVGRRLRDAGLAGRRACRCPAGSGRRGRRACRRGSRRRRAPLRTRRPRSRTRGARGPSRGTRSGPGTRGRRTGPCASRTARASGRSPGGAKNSRLCPSQAASSVHVSGPVKIRVGDRLGGHARTPLRGMLAGTASGARRNRSGGPVGGTDPRAH